MAGLKKARKAAAKNSTAKQVTLPRQQGYQTRAMEPAQPAVSPYVMTTGDMSKP